MSKKVLVIFAVVAVGLAGGIGFMLGGRDSDSGGSGPAAPVETVDPFEHYISYLQGWLEAGSCPSAAEVWRLGKSAKAWGQGYHDLTPAQQDLSDELNLKLADICPGIPDDQEFQQELADVIMADWLESCPSQAEYTGLLPSTAQEYLDFDKLLDQCPELWDFYEQISTPRS